MNDFLKKLFSKQTLAYATGLAQGQGTASTDEEARANHKAVRDGIRAYIESLDDRVTLIPFVGPILDGLVDSPAFEKTEDEWADFLAEMVYRPLKYADALGNK